MIISNVNSWCAYVQRNKNSFVKYHLQAKDSNEHLLWKTSMQAIKYFIRLQPVVEFSHQKS